MKPWDAPLIELPTTEAVRDYLVGKQVASDRAQAVASATKVPLSVTKRGALLFTRDLDVPQGCFRPGAHPSLRQTDDEGRRHDREARRQWKALTSG